MQVEHKKKTPWIISSNLEWRKVMDNMSTRRPKTTKSLSASAVERNWPRSPSLLEDGGVARLQLHDLHNTVFWDVVCPVYIELATNRRFHGELPYAFAAL